MCIICYISYHFFLFSYTCISKRIMKANNQLFELRFQLFFIRICYSLSSLIIYLCCCCCFLSLLYSQVFFLRHYHIPYTAYFSSCIYNSYTSRSAELLLISLITPRTTLLYCLLHWIAYCALLVTWLGACQAPYSEEVEKKNIHQVNTCMHQVSYLLNLCWWLGWIPSRRSSQVLFRFEFDIFLRPVFPNHY